MNKQQAVELVDSLKNNLIDPIALLNIVWLRVIINQIPDEEWNKALEKAEKICAS